MLGQRAPPRSRHRGPFDSVKQLNAQLIFHSFYLKADSGWRQPNDVPGGGKGFLFNDRKKCFELVDVHDNEIDHTIELKARCPVRSVLLAT
ncbi:MAG: hypothetical protein MPJ51_20980 [Ruegeria sp.]|nr:hypothetical protein [Ruegeria sp.]